MPRVLARDRRHRAVAPRRRSLRRHWPAIMSSRRFRSATRDARSRASATGPIRRCRRSPASATPRASSPARASGKAGVVTGKHGGIDTVLVDFPIETLRRLAIGDRIQIYAYGTGMRLLDHPDIKVTNCSPRLIARWGLHNDGGRLVVPVTHRIPAGADGIGPGPATTSCAATTTSRCSIPTPCGATSSARFASAISWRSSTPTTGSADPTGEASSPSVASCMARARVAGHGPGVATLLTGPQRAFSIRTDAQANIARLLNIRPLPRSARRCRSPFASGAGLPPANRQAIRSR